MKKITLMAAMLLMAVLGNAQSWVEQTSGTTAPLYDVQFLNDTMGWVSGQGVVLKTIDGGNTWVSNTNGITSTHQLFSIHFSSENIGWAVGTDGIIYKTTNGGSSWTTQTSGTSEMLMTVFFLNDSIGFVASGSQVAPSTTPVILKTIDGGNTWSQANSVFGQGQFFRSIFFESDSLGWIVGDYGQIGNSTDGGATFNSLTSGTSNRLRKVYFSSPSDGWTVGENGTILVTSDSGSTWTAKTSGTTNTLTDINVLSSNEAFAVGWFSTVLKTTDGGNNWVSVNDGIPGSTTIRASHFVSTSKGWIIGGSGKIYTYNPTATNVISTKESEINIFPNPINDFAYIQFEEAGTYQVEVLDLTGKVIYAQQTNEQNLQINTVAWAAGIYAVNISNENGLVERKKIVKN